LRPVVWSLYCKVETSKVNSGMLTIWTNSRANCMNAMHLQTWPNLELKIRPKQFLASLPWDLPFPGLCYQTSKSLTYKFNKKYMNMLSLFVFLHLACFSVYPLTWLVKPLRLTYTCELHCSVVGRKHQGCW